MCARGVCVVSVSIALLSGANLIAQSEVDPVTGRAVPVWARPAYEASSQGQWGAARADEDHWVKTEPPNPYEDAASAAATVSINRLQHKVPRKAINEWKKGGKACEKKRYAESAEHFLRAIQIDPQFDIGRNDLAALYMLVGNPSAAAVQLEQAIRIDPHTAMPYSNLAVAYMMLNRLAEAERAARNGMDLDRTSLRPRMILGMSLVMQGKMSGEALYLLQKAEPGFPQAHLLAARVLAAQGLRPKAKSEIQAYLDTGDQMGIDTAHFWLKILDDDGLNNADPLSAEYHAADSGR